MTDSLITAFYEFIRKATFKSLRPLCLLKGADEDPGVSPPLEKGAGGISFHIRTAGVPPCYNRYGS
jgi:hypothetical protein